MPGLQRELALDSPAGDPPWYLYQFPTNLQRSLRQLLYLSGLLFPMNTEEVGHMFPDKHWGDNDQIGGLTVT